MQIQISLFKSELLALVEASALQRAFDKVGFFLWKDALWPIRFMVQIQLKQILPDCLTFSLISQAIFLDLVMKKYFGNYL